MIHYQDILDFRILKPKSNWPYPEIIEQLFNNQFMVENPFDGGVKIGDFKRVSVKIRGEIVFFF